MDASLFLPPGSDPVGVLAFRRLKLWELPSGTLCSVVGTCLDQDALLRALPKLGLRPMTDAAPYEVHGFFVEKAASDNPVARMMNKMLDAAYGGEVRRFSRATDATVLRAMWEAATADGRVAPAYWAVLTHPRATPALRTHVHGEVHMLAHYMAGLNRTHIDRHGAAERRARDLAGALERQQRIAAEQAADLRRTIEVLKAELAARPAVPPTVPVAERSDVGEVERLRLRLDRMGRKLAAERARARAAEARAGRLHALLDDRPAVCPLARREPVGEGADEPPAALPETLRGRVILYVGGRSQTVHHLKSTAGRYAAELLHHDGGLEENIRTLDAMVERCDLVFCPIDCISHDACRRAKQLCKRLRKPFVPLRSSGSAGFFAVLRGLDRQGRTADPRA
jgi:hypothetical protein